MDRATSWRGRVWRVVNSEPVPEGSHLTVCQLADFIARAISQPGGVDVNTVTVWPIGAPV